MLPGLSALALASALVAIASPVPYAKRDEPKAVSRGLNCRSYVYLLTRLE
jgi:hypothetical protein